MSTFQVQDEGTFQVEVTDEFGCIATDELVLTEQCPTLIYAPNVFSPNRDGINDRFRLFATDIISFEMKIYDRWGSLMFTTSNQEEGWDGFWRGKPCQSGVYLWTASFEGYREDGSTYTAIESNSVTLIR
jgi:gliding motility-associated-like protein